MKELSKIQSTLNAPKGQYNSFGKYKYRSCEDILAAVKPLLKENNCTLTISDDILMVGNRIYVKATATISNDKGETNTTTAFAREEENKKGMDASQVTGAASSYARKYALNGLFAIDDTKDADTLNNSVEYTKSSSENQKSTIEPSQSEVFKAYAAPAIEQANTKEDLTKIYNQYQYLHTYKDFMNALSARKKALGI